MIELAKRMGRKVPWQNVEEFNDWQLEEVGVKFKEIQHKPNQMISFPIQYKKYEEKGFNTPTGKIEFRSTILEKAGYDSLPPYVEPPQARCAPPRSSGSTP